VEEDTSKVKKVAKLVVEVDYFPPPENKPRNPSYANPSSGRQTIRRMREHGFHASEEFWKSLEDIRIDDLDLEAGGELRAEKLLANSWWLSYEERDVGEGRYTDDCEDLIEEAKCTTAA